MANDENFEDDEHLFVADGLVALEGAGRDVAGWRTASDNPELHSNWSRCNDGSVLDTVDLAQWP
jgi:hypothetical protein